MLRFIMRFWPILLPLVIYFAWLWVARHKARKSGDILPGLGDGPWVWAVAATLGLAAALFIYLGLSSTPNDGNYVPAHTKNGKLIPGRVGAP